MAEAAMGESVDLSPEITEWITRTIGGPIVRLERAVARREAWLVDIALSEGRVCETFLRVEGTSHPDDPSSLAKEVAIVRALRDTGVPVSEVYGCDDRLGCALFERLKGRADLPNVPVPRQRAVMRDFMDIVARLHQLDPDALALPPLRRPADAMECALGDVDQLLRRHETFLRRSFDPLLKYAIDWLRRFAPESVPRISLLQGDTGPANFMFEGDRVSAVFDWEWGHLGDPREDLGNIAVREFWNPSGGMAGLIDRYEAATGMAIDRDVVRYYRVQQQVRGMFGIHAATENAISREPITWYLAYRYVGDRATCEALGEAMHIPLAPPPMMSDDGVIGSLAQAAVWALEQDITPAITTPFARHRAKEVGILVHCLDRVAQFGRWADEADMADIAALLGHASNSLADATAALNAAIDGNVLDDRALVTMLYRRAYRREWLFEPCAQLYPGRHWSAL